MHAWAGKAWPQRQRQQHGQVAEACIAAAAVVIPPRLTHLQHTPKPHRQPLRTQAHSHQGAFCLALMSSAPIQNGNGGGKEDGGRGGGGDTAARPTLQLPLLLTATVVKGFGRGSKLLGIPTGKFKNFVLRRVSLCLGQESLSPSSLPSPSFYKSGRSSWLSSCVAYLFMYFLLFPSTTQQIWTWSK